MKAPLRFGLFAAMLVLAVLAAPLARAEVGAGTIQSNDFIVGPGIDDGRARLFSGVDGSSKGVLFGSEPAWNWVHHLAYGPDGYLYASNGGDGGGSIRRYEGLTGTRDESFEIGVNVTAGLAFGSDGYLYAGATFGGSGQLWRINVGTGQVEWVLEVGYDLGDGGTYFWAGDMTAGSDGRIYVSFFGPGFGRVWRYDPTTSIGEEILQGSPVVGLAFGPDGYLYGATSLGEFPRVIRLDVTTTTWDDIIPPGTDGLVHIWDVAFHPGDNSLHVLGLWGDWNGEPSVGQWDPVSGTFSRKLPVGHVKIERTHVELLFPAVVTQPGLEVSVTPHTGSQITFEQVSQPGVTTVTPLNSAESALPANFQIDGATTQHTTYFDITTTAQFSGTVRLTLAYNEQAFTWHPITNPGGQRPLLLHLGELYTDTNGNHQRDSGESFVDQNANGIYDANLWVELLNQSVDAETHTVSGDTTVFSPFAIATRLAYSWSGVLEPVNADGSSVFKLGRTVPVKFRLTGGDAGLTNLQARLYVAKISNDVVGTEEEASSTSAATSGNLFRYDPASGQYVFNLGTGALSEGTWQLRIDLGGGNPHLVTFSLRR